MFKVHVKQYTPEGQQLPEETREYYEMFDAHTVANIEKHNALMSTGATEIHTGNRMVYTVQQFGGGQILVWITNARGMMVGLRPTKGI